MKILLLYTHAVDLYFKVIYSLENSSGMFEAGTGADVAGFIA